MDLKPIKSAADHDAALLRIEQLWGAAGGTREGDELDILIALTAAYEREHYPIDRPDPIEAIKFRLEQEGKDLSSLIGVIGHRTRVYEVMRRSRPLSLNMIRRLNSEFKIPAEVLIQPTKRRSKASKREGAVRAGKAKKSA
jgi:HTH-type transcriptional regulator / antitoxin HigA